MPMTKFPHVSPSANRCRGDNGNITSQAFSEGNVCVASKRGQGDRLVCSPDFFSMGPSQGYEKITSC